MNAPRHRRRASNRWGSLVTWALALTLGAWATACGPDFDPPSELNSLRILAVRAEPPEARPGQEVTLDALDWVPEGSAPPDSAGTLGADADGALREWRACFLTQDLAGLGGPPGTGAFDPASGERRPESCFDLPEAITVAELQESLVGGDAAALPALDEVALDLGRGPVATLPGLPLPAAPGPPSFCAELSDSARVEQGGREAWIAGVRFTVSLRLSTASETVVANKRVVVRPDPLELSEAEQGRPFRTPRLCAGLDGDSPGPCARNENPDPPTVEVVDLAWDDSGPLQLAPGQQVRLLPREPGAVDQQPFVAMGRCGEQLEDPALAAAGGEFERLEGRFYAWFADGGSVLRDTSVLGRQEGTRDSGYRAPRSVDGPTSYTLLAVTWDGRGGVAWTEVPILVRPGS